MLRFKIGILALILFMGQARQFAPPTSLTSNKATEIAPTGEYQTHKYQGLIYHEGGSAHTTVAGAIREAGKVIRKKIASGMKQRFSKLFEKLTQFSDDDGFVRPGIVFCGASHNEISGNLLQGDEGEPAIPSSFHASGARLIDYDGYGQVEYGTCQCPSSGCITGYDNYDHIITEAECNYWSGDFIQPATDVPNSAAKFKIYEASQCGINNCQEGSFIASVATQIRASGYQIQHRDICKALAEKVTISARTANLSPYAESKALVCDNPYWYERLEECIGVAPVAGVCATGCVIVAGGGEEQDRKCFVDANYHAATCSIADIATNGKQEENIPAEPSVNSVRRIMRYSVNEELSAKTTDYAYFTGCKTGTCLSLRSMIAAINGNAQVNAFRDLNVNEANDYWEEQIKSVRTYLKSLATEFSHFRETTMQIFPYIENEEIRSQCPQGEIEFTPGDTGIEIAPLCYKKGNLLTVVNTLSRDGQFVSRADCVCRNGKLSDTGEEKLIRADVEQDDIYLNLEWSKDKDCSVYPASAETYCNNAEWHGAREWKETLLSLLPANTRSRIKIYHKQYTGEQDIQLKIRTEIRDGRNKIVADIEKTLPTALDTSCGRIVTADADSQADASKVMVSNKGYNCLPFDAMHRIFYKLEFETGKIGMGAPRDADGTTLSDNYCAQKIADIEPSFRQLSYKFLKKDNNLLQEGEPFTGYPDDTQMDFLTYTGIIQQDSNGDDFERTFCVPNWLLEFGVRSQKDSFGNEFVDPFELAELLVDEAVFNTELASSTKDRAITDNVLLWNAVRKELTTAEEGNIIDDIASAAAYHYLMVLSTDSDDLLDEVVYRSKQRVIDQVTKFVKQIQPVATNMHDVVTELDAILETANDDFLILTKAQSTAKVTTAFSSIRTLLENMDLADPLLSETSRRLASRNLAHACGHSCACCFEDFQNDAFYSSYIADSGAFMLPTDEFIDRTTSCNICAANMPDRTAADGVNVWNELSIKAPHAPSDLTSVDGFIKDKLDDGMAAILTQVTLITADIRNLATGANQENDEQSAQDIQEKIYDIYTLVTSLEENILLKTGDLWDYVQAVTAYNAFWNDDLRLGVTPVPVAANAITADWTTGTWPTYTSAVAACEAEVTRQYNLVNSNTWAVDKAIYDAKGVDSEEINLLNRLANTQNMLYTLAETCNTTNIQKTTYDADKAAYDSSVSDCNTAYPFLLADTCTAARAAIIARNTANSEYLVIVEAEAKILAEDTASEITVIEGLIAALDSGLGGSIASARLGLISSIKKFTGQTVKSHDTQHLSANLKVKYNLCATNRVAAYAEIGTHYNFSLDDDSTTGNVQNGVNAENALSTNNDDKNIFLDKLLDSTTELDAISIDEFCDYTLWDTMNDNYNSTTTQFIEVDSQTNSFVLRCIEGNAYDTETEKCVKSPCTPGHYSKYVSALESVCTACPAGQKGSGTDELQFNIGDTECQPCATGWYSSTSGSSICIEAAAGTHANANADGVEPCLAGTYQDETGKISCKPAEVGHYTSTHSATAPVICAAKTYQPAPGQTSCLIAPEGFYVSAPGATESLPCYPGTYTMGVHSGATYLGASSCLTCPIGSRIATVAVLEGVCTYSNGGGMGQCGTSCVSCPDGSYCNGEGTYTNKVNIEVFSSTESDFVCDKGGDWNLWTDEPQTCQTDSEGNCKDASSPCIPRTCNCENGNPTKGLECSVLGAEECVSCDSESGLYPKKIDGVIVAGKYQCHTCSQPMVSTGANSFGHTLSKCAVGNCTFGEGYPVSGLDYSLIDQSEDVDGSIESAGCGLCPKGSYSDTDSSGQCQIILDGFGCTKLGEILVNTLAQPTWYNQSGCEQVGACPAGFFRTSSGAVGSGTTNWCAPIPDGQLCNHYKDTATAESNSVTAQSLTPSTGCIGVGNCPAGKYRSVDLAQNNCADISDGQECVLSIDTLAMGATGCSEVNDCQKGNYRNSNSGGLSTAAAFNGGSLCTAIDAGKGCSELREPVSPEPSGGANNATGCKTIDLCSNGYFDDDGTFCIKIQAGWGCDTNIGLVGMQQKGKGCTGEYKCPTSTSATEHRRAATVSDVSTGCQNSGDDGCSILDFTLCQPVPAGQGCAVAARDEGVVLYGTPAPTADDNGCITTVPCRGDTYPLNEVNDMGQWNAAGASTFAAFCKPRAICIQGGFGIRQVSSSTTLARTEPSYCNSCDAGQFSPAIDAGLSGNGGSPCGPCGPGRFSSLSGAPSCGEVAAGSEITGSNTGFRLCLAGTYQEEAGKQTCTSITSADTGKYQDQTGQTSMKTAGKGFHADSTDRKIITACAVGTVQPAEEKDSCNLCETGKYQDETGKETCKVCAIGKSQPDTGKNSCDDCATGKFQDETSQSSCKPSSIGHYNGVQGQSVESVCAVGTFQSETGQSSCQPIGDGLRCQQFANSSVENNAAISDTATKCISIFGCPQGTYRNQTLNPNTNKCIEAAIGNKVTTIGQSEETPCATGTYQDLTGQASCKDATEGYEVSTIGQSVQTACATGYWQKDTAQSSCDTIQGGKRCNTTAEGTIVTTACVSTALCSSGKYRAETDALNTCTENAVGYYVVAATATTGAATTQPCAAGTYQDIAGQTSCKLCEVGKQQSQTGQTTCVECVLGKYQANTGQPTCVDCSTGTYQDVVGQTSCTDTPAGFKINVVSALNVGILPNECQCNNGEAVTTAADYTSGSTLPICKDETDQHCATCTYEYGKYSFGDGAYNHICYDCTLFISGLFQGVNTSTANAVDQSSSVCAVKSCPVGQGYPIIDDSSLHTDVQEFQQFIDAVNASLRLTPSVEFGVNYICSNCAAGTFSDSDSVGQCTVCPAGKFSATPGATACGQHSAVCVAGSYQSVAPTPSNDRTCVICGAGTYAATTSATQCSTCPSGSYCDDESTAPELCTAGTSSDSGMTDDDADSSTVCTACGDGKRSPTLRWGPCIDNTCGGTPAAPDYGTVLINNGNNWGSRASFTCNTGYTLSFSTDLICQARYTNGNWPSATPQCFPNTCGAITNGGSDNDAYTSSCSDIASGSDCTLSCSATGYSGSEAQRCTTGAYATLVAPTCTADACGNIAAGGAANQAYTSSCSASDVDSGADCTLTCSATGYSGSEAQRCTAGAYATLVVPTCAADACTDNTANGGTGNNAYTTDCTGTDVVSGAACTLTCSATGYSGTSTRLCTAGTYAAVVAPICAADACTDNTANGGTGNNAYTTDCTGTDVASGSACTLTCSAAGYSGTSTRLCTAGAYATLVVPTCAADACTDNTANGGTGNNAYTTDCVSTDVASGSACTLTCSAAGYSGTSTRLCTAGTYAAVVAPICTM